MTVIERPDLGVAVARELRSLILRGDLHPGQRLVETDLAHRFGTSRGPVRDALVQLERSGLVTVQPRRGSFVRELSPADVDEVYSLRIALESLAVHRLVELGAPDPTAELRAPLDALDAAHRAGDRSAVGEADMALHHALVAASGHRRLLESWDRLGDQTMFLMSVLSSVDPIIQGPDGDHAAIVALIESGDARAATAALERHLTTAREAMLAHWSAGRPEVRPA